MTAEEFDFWQRAYLAALAGVAGDPDSSDTGCALFSRTMAVLAVESYRAAKATVVQADHA